MGAERPKFTCHADLCTTGSNVRGELAPPAWSCFSCLTRHDQTDSADSSPPRGAEARWLTPARCAALVQCLVPDCRVQVVGSTKLKHAGGSWGQQPEESRAGQGICEVLLVKCLYCHPPRRSLTHSLPTYA